MNSPGTSFLIQQLPYQLPMLLVCLGGFAVAAIFLNRHFNAAALVMVGTALLILAALGVMIGQFMLLQGGNPSSRQLMQVVAVLGSLMRALGTAVIIAAVFVGRSQPTPFQNSPPGYPRQPLVK